VDDNFAKILVPFFIPFVSLRVKVGVGVGVGVFCAHPSLSPKVSIDLVVIKLTRHVKHPNLVT